MKYFSFLLIISLLALTGCATIGPDTVPRDRFDYNTAIADSWKEQTLLNIVKQIQNAGNSSMRILKDEDQKETTVIFIHRNLSRPGHMKTLKELEMLLGLAPDTNELNVTYGIIPETDRELAMQTRSMLQIMIELATQIDVPPEHVEEGRTVPTMIPPGSVEKEVIQFVKVHSDPDSPENAFVSVNYKDYWFWIDDRDFHSKRAFTFVMILFSLTETGGKGEFPLVTIPAG
jgi:predicted small lipoprotein YifL